MNAKQRIDKAYQLLSAIPVQGDDVDIMFAVRQELRAAFQELTEKEAKTDGRQTNK